MEPGLVVPRDETKIVPLRVPPPKLDPVYNAITRLRIEIDRVDEVLSYLSLRKWGEAL